MKSKTKTKTPTLRDLIVDVDTVHGAILDAALHDPKDNYLRELYGRGRTLRQFLSGAQAGHVSSAPRARKFFDGLLHELRHDFNSAKRAKGGK